MLHHVMPSPPLPSSPQPLKPRRGPSPGNPPLVPKPPLQGPVRSAEAPESLSASPYPAAGRRWADSPAPRQPSRRGAVTQPLPFSAPQDYPPGSPRGPAPRRGAEPGPRLLTPPQERCRPPQGEQSLGRRVKPRRVGVCSRAWIRCPGARYLQPPPGPCPQLRGAGASRSQPEEPVPARRRLLRQRRGVSLALRAASPSPPPTQLWLLQRVR